jgi:hypothetical protein
MGIASDLLGKLEQKNGELGKKLRAVSKFTKNVESIIEEEAPAIRDRIKARMEELKNGGKPAAKKPEAKPAAKKPEAKPAAKKPK